MEFINLYTKQTINTDDYLVTFVDEFTGEVKENRRVLDKRISKLWFRSQMPEAVILTDVQEVSRQTPDAMPVPTMLAHARIVTAGNAVLAENWSLRQSASMEGESPFGYYTEAAINAAVDRCLIDLGFVVAEELEKAPSVNPTPDVLPQQQAIADIEQLIESDEEANAPVAAPSYDRTTPVDEILKVMDAATARTVVFENGRYRGKTVGEVYESTKDANGFSGKLGWFADNYRTNNILVAACIIVNPNNR